MSTSLLFQMIDQLSREKGIDAQIIISAVEDAILVATRKYYKSTEDLQAKMGAHMSDVDATFFNTVNQVVARLHERGKHDAARHLSAVGDSFARLRFMI